MRKTWKYVHQIVTLVESLLQVVVAESKKDLFFNYIYLFI